MHPLKVIALLVLSKLYLKIKLTKVSKITQKNPPPTQIADYFILNSLQMWGFSNKIQTNQHGCFSSFLYVRHSY